MTERRLALIVTVDDPTLPHPHGDPNLGVGPLVEVLGDPNLGAFDVDILADPTPMVARQRLADLLAGRDATDLVLLYYSCRGPLTAPPPAPAATDTTPEPLPSASVDIAWITQAMSRSRAGGIALILDCQTTADTGADIDPGTHHRPQHLDPTNTRVIITATTTVGAATGGPRPVDRPSAFMAALVDGIRSGAADYDRDGEISLAELYDHVLDDLRKHPSDQPPRKWEHGDPGCLIIARSPLPPAGPLPAELHTLIDHPVAAARIEAVDLLAHLASSPDPAQATAAHQALTQLTRDNTPTVAGAARTALERSAHTGGPAPTTDTDTTHEGGSPSTRGEPLNNPANPKSPERDPKRRRAGLQFAAAGIVIVIVIVVVVVARIGGRSPATTSTSQAGPTSVTATLVTTPYRAPAAPYSYPQPATTLPVATPRIVQPWVTMPSIPTFHRIDPSMYALPSTIRIAPATPTPYATDTCLTGTIPDSTTTVSVSDVTEVPCSSDTAHYQVIQAFPDTTDLSLCDSNPDTQYEFSSSWTYGTMSDQHVYCLIGIGTH